ncbi:mannitol dehydrogenase domain-containing protein [Favolaschia claudopus]|uniref:Mannitol-1-phosphate 5-dehydrogenase n=1 Tax=Favolaschia claudopus TaxID=2862362 RepID=A0AAW0BGD5_9AGAR
MSIKPRAIHFGAGNIGRGFIAPLLSTSGYHVVFTDVDKSLIDAINQQRAYGVHILDSTSDDAVNGDNGSLHSSSSSASLSTLSSVSTVSTAEVHEIKHVKGVLSTTDALIHEIEHPKLKLITTAVGLPVIDKIAPTIANGIKARRKAGGGPINIIACENAIGATAKLAEKVRAKLEGDDAKWAEKNVGFANCSVDRIVPPFDPSEHDESSELDVGVEAFYEWVVESGPLKPNGELEVPIEGMRLADNLKPYNERKLFTLNTGHAITAYLGHLKGHATIADSIADEEILVCVRGALLKESGVALCKRHPEYFNEEQHAEYVEKIIKRFENAAVKDDVVRVGRQPLRKLGKEDRLVGPARMCVEYGIDVRFLATGIAAALCYENDEDEDTTKIKQAVSDKGVEGYITELTEFGKGGEGEVVFERIVQSYNELKGAKSQKN